MKSLLRPIVLVLLALALAACAAPRAMSPATPPEPEAAAPVAGSPAGPSVPGAGPGAQDVAPQVTLIRSPSCGCCGGHAEHLADAGYRVSSTLTEAYTTVKDAHRIPADMRSCHTSLVDRYFVEGHVPAAAIEQLLRQSPQIDGIALPGMPAGSPGMGGVADGLLTIYAIDDGQVVGEFGQFAAPTDQ